MKLSTIYQICVASAVVELATASSFLSSATLAHHAAWDKAPTAEMKQAIMTEIEEGLGDGNHKVKEARVADLESRLRPMLAALPKNEHGRLGHVVVRYALHRLFVQRHGWFVRGLEPGGESWNASSPLDALKGGVPELVQALFEKRMGDKGAEVHDVALLAAILENMAHQEAAVRLRAAYVALEFDPETAKLKSSLVNLVLDMYMTAYILGEELSEIPHGMALDRMNEKGELYSGWEDTRAFVRTVRKDVLEEREHLDFSEVLSIVSAIGDRHGRWQDQECKDLKKQLLTIEDDGTGRVPLSKFYKSAYESNDYQFSESSAYLRQLGALDDSDPENLKVIVPNYVLSPSNCISSSMYYSVCCIDECEDLLGALENKLQAPEATASEIAVIVADLPSATMPANRKLSALLLRRLEEVEESNGGRVPLHGRLFAQWLHHAYPRECPFPHLAGTITPQREEEYCNSIDGEAHASPEEMLQHIASEKKNGTTRAPAEFAPWHKKEELLQEEKSAPAPRSRSMKPALIVLGMAGLSALGIAKTSRKKLEKYCV